VGLGAEDPNAARKALLMSSASVSVYITNQRGQRFGVSPTVMIDDGGWKVFQFNYSTASLGPYATATPTFAPTTPTPTPIPTPNPTTLPPTPVPTTLPPTGMPTTYSGMASGFVYDAVTGKPLRGAIVTPKNKRLRRLLADLAERGDGTFHLINIPTGEQELTASAVGYISVTKTVTAWDVSTTGCAYFVLSPELDESKKQIRTVLEWRETSRPMASFLGVADCWSTAYAPHCTHKSVVGGVGRTSDNVHNIEIPKLGQGKCTFGLSTITLTGEGATIAKYMVAIKGDVDMAIIGKGGSGAFVTATQLEKLKKDYEGSGADVTFYTSNTYADDQHFSVEPSSWVDAEGWHVLNFDSNSRVVVDWSKGIKN